MELGNPWNARLKYLRWPRSRAAKTRLTHDAAPPTPAKPENGVRNRRSRGPNLPVSRWRGAARAEEGGRACEGVRASCPRRSENSRCTVGNTSSPGDRGAAQLGV